MQRNIELLYLIAISALAPPIFKALAFLVSEMHSRFWVIVLFFIVLQALNVIRIIRNKINTWRLVYTILIVLNLLAFVLLSHLTIFSTPFAIYQIVSSLQF